MRFDMIIYWQKNKYGHQHRNNTCLTACSFYKDNAPKHSEIETYHF